MLCMHAHIHFCLSPFEVFNRENRWAPWTGASDWDSVSFREEQCASRANFSSSCSFMRISREFATLHPSVLAYILKCTQSLHLLSVCCT